MGSPLAVPPKFSKLFAVNHEKVLLMFGRRKNAEQHSTWTRSCKCAIAKELCPVHVLWEFVDRLEIGDRLFPRMTQDVFNATLKRRAFAIAMKDAPKVSRNAFRCTFSAPLADTSALRSLGAELVGCKHAPAVLRMTVLSDVMRVESNRFVDLR